MAEILRVSSEEIRPRVTAGKALLVCAYEDEDTFRSMRLEGAISLKDLESRLPILPRDQEIVFYCA
jgi:hypothetical protein